MKSRILLIFFVFFVLWVGLILKALTLQVFPNQRLSHLQKKQFEKIITLHPRRGVVVDRNNKELAISVNAYSLFADPSLIKHPRFLSRRLSKELGVSYSSIYKKVLRKHRRFVWLKRQLDEKQANRIKAWKEVGLGFVEEPKRVYTNPGSLSQILGFVGRDGEGLEGLEAQYDAELSGKERTLQLRKDARGRPLLINGQVFTDYPDGSNLQLTIDSNVQFTVEKELEHAVESHDADSAMALVLDSKSGEIVAMVNWPGYNNNRPLLFEPALRRNKIVSDAFEPGSTMKTFILAAALNARSVQPNTKIFCEDGSFKVTNRIIREADDKHKFGWLSVGEILAFSSNIGSAKVAMRLSDNSLYDYLQKLGFGTRSGLEFGGESRGILNPPPWNKHLHASIGFGHGVATTPLQITLAYNAIANGGWIVEPLLVKKIFNDVKEEETTKQARQVRRVFTKEQAEILRMLLVASTARTSTGYSARVKGYPVAGKTGTAQKVDTQKGGYIKDSYIASFAGMVPANDPKYVVFVAVDNPRKSYYGSEVAAPVFSKIAGYLMRKDGIEPVLLSGSDLTSPVKPKLPVASTQTPVSDRVPNLFGLTLRDVYNRLNGSGIEIRARGSGLVSSVQPAPGEEIPPSKRIHLTLSPIE